MYGMGKHSTRACTYWIQLCLDSGWRIQLAPIPQDMGVKQKTLCLSDKSFNDQSMTWKDACGIFKVLKIEEREGVT